MIMGKRAYLLFHSVLLSLCTGTISIQVFRRLTNRKLQTQQNRLYDGIISTHGGAMESDVDRRPSQVRDMEEQVVHTENVEDEGDSSYSDTVHQVEDDLVEVHPSEESQEEEELDDLVDVSADDYSNLEYDNLSSTHIHDQGDNLNIEENGIDFHVEGHSSEESQEEKELDDLVDVSADDYRNSEYDDLSSTQVIDQGDNLNIEENKMDIDAGLVEGALDETNQEIYNEIHEIDENILSQDDEEEDLVQAQEDAFADVTALDEDDDATDYFGVMRNAVEDELILAKKANTDNETVLQTDGDESMIGKNDDTYSYDLNDLVISCDHANTEEVEMKSGDQSIKESANSYSDINSVGYLNESMYDGYDVSDSDSNEQVQTWYVPMDEEENKENLGETQVENAKEIAEVEENRKAEITHAINDSSDDIDYPSGSDSTAFDRMDLADAYDDDESTIDDIASISQGEETKALDQFSSSKPTTPPMTRDTGPTVQYMITQNMRRVLVRDLGYTNQEINNMKPDVATVIVSKMLKRPRSGVPAAFYVEGTMLPKPQTKRWGMGQRALMKRAILPGLIGIATVGVTILGGSTKDDIDKEGRVCQISTEIPPVEEDESCTTRTDEFLRSKKTLSATTNLASESITEKDLALGTVDDETVILKDKDLDKSWLDRAISTVLEKLDEARKRPF